MTSQLSQLWLSGETHHCSRSSVSLFECLDNAPHTGRRARFYGHLTTAVHPPGRPPLPPPATTVDGCCTAARLRWLNGFGGLVLESSRMHFRSCTISIMHSALLIQGESKKSRPPKTSNDIFAWAESFCIELYTLIGNLYPRMCTNFCSVILTCNEMALILSRSPIIFTVSSLDCSAGNKNAVFQLNGNDVIG